MTAIVHPCLPSSTDLRCNAGVSTHTDPWPPGTPCWADLSTPDVDAALAFYGDVLGWTFPPAEEQYGGYRIAQVDRRTAAGIGPLPDPGMQTAWTLYLASDDADASQSAVEQNGGTILLPAGDIGELGRMFIASDPTGGAFGVWQAKQHIGTGVVNEPGALVWEDLRSTDPDAARTFYASVFGYSYEAVDGAGDDYTLFAPGKGKPPLGGLGPLMGSPDGTPSHWLAYFGVSDTDATITSAEHRGGSVVAPAFDTPYGRMAGIADPAGGVFMVISVTADADWRA
jgi:hypothetical protein